MPYSTNADLPTAVQKLPDAAQTIWRKAFNDAYDGTCKDDSDSEGCASAIGYTAVKDAGYEKDASGEWKQKAANARSEHGELIALASVGDLENVADKKIITIQVLRAGEFVDMYGTDVPITADDLDSYIANSNALLSGEQIPIELGHPDDAGAPASAWYRSFFKKAVNGVEWVCAEIELTALGAQALADQLYKYFSANLWLDDKVVSGGGFVNRPAVSGQQPIGALAAYLRPAPPAPKGVPMTLAKTMTAPKQSRLNALWADITKRLTQAVKLEMSYEDTQQSLWCALRDKYGDPMDEWGGSYPWLAETRAEYAIVNQDGKYFRVPYTLDDAGGVMLGAPVEVIRGDWQDAPAATVDAIVAANLGAAALTDVPSTTTNANAALATPVAQIPAPNSGGTMPDAILTTPAPLSAPVIPATNPLPYPEIDPTLPMEERIRLAREQAASAALEQQRAFEVQLTNARTEAWANAQLEMARKQRVAALAQKLTSGNHQFPYQPQVLEDVLFRLSDADRDLIAPILETIHDRGLVEMSEFGHSRNGHGNKPLPEYAVAQLKAWLAKDMPLADFFKANAELGDAAQYDLFDFEKKG